MLGRIPATLELLVYSFSNRRDLNSRNLAYEETKVLPCHRACYSSAIAGGGKGRWQRKATSAYNALTKG